MASFAIEPAFWELFPQAEIGIVVARGIDNAHESSEDVKAALVEANKAALAHVPDPTISKNPAVAVWREAFQQFETPGERSSELVAALVDVWERSVRATHDFLAEDDIVGLRPEAESGIAGVERLTVAYDGGAPCGFAGSQDGKLEMLFVAPEVRGRGVGRALLAHAVEHAGVRTLDVNEQNPQAVGFYEHEGFVVAGRSPVDDAGRPFPLLHMRRACDDEEGERS